MKSLSTYLIATCLFVLCLFEKEAKQEALEAQRLKEKSTENQQVNIQKIPLPVYTSTQKNSNITSLFELAQYVETDSLSNTENSAESL